jgi:tetratricopeptide (TPR) repeat protein
MTSRGPEPDASLTQDTFEALWERLAEPEQDALLRLSWFPDGFTLDVASRALLPGSDTEALIARLTQEEVLKKTDAIAVRYSEPDVRYAVPDALRDHALRKLSSLSSVNEMCNRSASALIAVTREWWRESQYSGDLAALELIDIEIENLMHAARTAGNEEVGAWAAVIAASNNRNAYPKAQLRALVAPFRESPPPGELGTWVKLTECRYRIEEKPGEVDAALRSAKCEGPARYNQLLLRSSAMLAMGRIKEALKLAEEASELPDVSPMRRAQALDRVGTIHEHQGNEAEARRCHLGALEVARKYGNEDTEATALYHLGRAANRHGRIDEALKLHIEAAQLAKRSGNRETEQFCQSGLGLMLHLKGQPEKAEACMKRAIQLARELGSPHNEAITLNTWTRILSEEGRHKEALENAERAAQLAKDVGSIQVLGVSLGNVAAVRSYVESPEAALDDFRNAYKILAQLGDVRSSTGALANVGAVLTIRWEEHGDREALKEALQTLREVRRLCKQHDLAVLMAPGLALARCLIDSGEHTEAREVLEDIRQHAEKQKTRPAEHALRKLTELLQEMEESPAVRIPRKRGRRKGSRVPTAAPPKATEQVPAPKIVREPGTERPTAKVPPLAKVRVRSGLTGKPLGKKRPRLK